jgi:ribosomal protein S18 acetylase RimI-like enzyme
VSDLDELLRYWRPVDLLFDRVRDTWWGAVVTDPRFPHIHEANYARVDVRRPVRLADIEEVLLPAARAARSPIAHAVVFHPGDQTDLLAEAGSRGERLAWDLVMRRSDLPPQVDDAIEPVTTHDVRFWPAYRAVQRVFGVEDDDVIEEMIALERGVMIPAGRTWFAARDRLEIVALASMLIREGIAFVDGVATLPAARRRGHATALTKGILREAADRGAKATYLLAEPGGEAERIYRRLGFEGIAQIASWVARLPTPEPGAPRAT